MRNKTLLAATLALPLLLLGCDAADQSPTAANPSEDRQAMTPSTEDRMLEKSAPAAGTMDPAMPSEPASTMPPASPSGDTPPASQSEPSSDPKPSSSY